MFRVEPSVPANVKVLLQVSVLPSAIVRVALVAGAVIATLFTLVAVATPIVGVTRVGEVARTTEPDPVVVAAEIAVPFPCKIPVIEVLRVRAGVAPPEDVPARPLAEATLIEVTVPEPFAFHRAIEVFIISESTVLYIFELFRSCATVPPAPVI
jgi:hypothetical protein